MPDADPVLVRVIIESSIIALFALVFGWFGAAAHAYYSEKGKNLATKQDISDITKKIEEIKYANQKNFYKSSNLIGRQIKAFDVIADEIAELQKYCLRKITEEQGNEHAVPYEDIPKKSSFQRSFHILEIARQQRVFISQEICDQIENLSQSLFMLGHAEMRTNEIGPVGPDFYESIDSRAKAIMASMQNEVFSAKGPSLS